MPAPSFESNVCVTGVARNCAEHLPLVIQNLEALAGIYPNISYSLYENDSEDESGQILQDWASGKENVTLHQEQGVLKFYPDRVDRICYARNIALDNIKKVSPDVELILNIDMDNVFCSPIQKNSFDSAMNLLQTCDVVTANGYGGYYDIYALRIPGVLEYDCWDYYYDLQKNQGMSKEEAVVAAVEKWKDYMPTITEPIEVASAFNAAALYRAAAFEGGIRYTTQSLAGKKVCEHVGLHERMRANGKKIMFDPGFKI